MLELKSGYKIANYTKNGAFLDMPLHSKLFFSKKHIKLGQFQSDARRCHHFGHIDVCSYNNRWKTGSPKTYKIFEVNFRKIDFSQNFDDKSLQFYFKSELLMLWGFFWGTACLSSSKIDKPQIFTYDISLFTIGNFSDLLRPN